MNGSKLIEHAKNGDADSVRRILDAEAGLVSFRDDSGATALHYCALHGHREVSRLLIERGADVNCRDSRFGATPTGWAIEFFREKGGLLAIEIDDMVHAISIGDLDWAQRLLLRFPALRSARSDEGVSLFELAVRSANDQIRELFNVPND